MHRNADQLLARARERFTAGDWFGTLYLVDELLETEAGFADAHQLRGVALALLGRPDDALVAFETALARNPEYVEALVHRGVVLAELGRGDEAAQSFEQATRAQEGSGRFPRAVAGRLANLHGQLGEAYADAGAPHEAVFEYRRALSLGPDFHDLRYRLGRHLVAGGRYLEAREELERVLRVRPDLDEARTTLGLARYLSGDTDGARAVWRDCRERAPDDVRIDAYLAMVERVPR
jgi:tetratricopeptide (TPR) repeat protein